MPCLVVSVRFHEGRYHGKPEWPPSPGRLFQALLAAAAQGDVLVEEDRSALAWLESLEPPIIAAPPARRGQGFRNFVPNNDLDAVGGDPTRIGEIRTPKLTQPILIPVDTPLLYFWWFEAGPKSSPHAQRLRGIAER